MTATMGELRTRMNAELKRAGIPVLRKHAFKGSMPHFRRRQKDGTDLLTFQFDKWGGGSIIEIARCGNDGITTSWGKHIASDVATAWDPHPDNRFRIQPRPGSGTDAWFRFDDGNFRKTAEEFIAELPRAEEWWRTRSA